MLASRLLSSDESLAELNLNNNQLKGVDENAPLGGKIILVSKREEYVDVLNFHFNPMGFEIIVYQDPEPLIENIGSLDPDMIIFDDIEYPRHWKPLLKMLRESKTQEEGTVSNCRRR